MKIKNVLVLALTLLVVCACSSSKKQDQTINLSGAFALYPLVIKWTEEYKKVNPDIRFNVSAGGAGKGMADALSGTVELGMFSREISQEEKDKGVWWVAVTKDAVIPTINANNPVASILKKRGLTRNEFVAIYLTGEITNWKQVVGINTDLAINVFTRSDACGAAGTWADYLGGTQEELKGIGVFGDPGLADAVIKDEKGIGYNNTIYLYDSKTGKKNDGIEIIPFDVNENGAIEPEEYFYDDLHKILDAIASGAFPSPPARDLYLVANGKPQKKATIDFLKWVITEGQSFVTDAGYVPLDKEKLDLELLKLN